MPNAFSCADRRQSGDSVPSSSSKRNWANPARALSGLFTFGQNWLQGSPCDVPNDRLLQDIGVSRADIEAMRL